VTPKLPPEKSFVKTFKKMFMIFGREPVEGSFAQCCRALMRISTETHYASRLLLAVALHADRTPLYAGDLAGNTGIPLDCVDDVMDSLRSAGLVNSDEDAGFRLGARPEDISLGLVLRVMEDGIRLNHCRSPEDRCPECHKCKTKDVWAGVIEAIERELETITLADLMGTLPAVPEPEGVRGVGRASL